MSDALRQIFDELGLDPARAHSAASGIDAPGGPRLASINPTDESVLGEVVQASADDYETVVAQATGAFADWRMRPAPARGEVVRQFGEALRQHKTALGRLVALEMGKIEAEGLGEVQEAIDIAEFAVGLSRQLYGLSMHSERPQHRMYEQWHPLGTIGIITAFNFPVAVWAWNAMIAAVCGDTMIWKPSPETPLVSVAVQALCDRVLAENGCPGVMTLALGETETVGHRMVADRRLPLISATGSCAMGRAVNQVVAGRLGRVLLELGGNNALIVMDDADPELALRAVLFGAAGTAGQRCTSTRRLFVHNTIKDAFVARLEAAYPQIKVGDPLAPGTLMGPLINGRSVASFEAAVAAIRAAGGDIRVGGGRPSGAGFERGFWVEPTVAVVGADLPLLQEETFAPILYVVGFDDLEQVMGWHNAVPQGLSSAIFTDSIRTAERFLSAAGSDCGIANVNIGTSGAEIGGAFGGEKDTGGGREAGSDSWKAYMRRQTCTINWGDDLPLAQGITFG